MQEGLKIKQIKALFGAADADRKVADRIELCWNTRDLSRSECSERLIDVGRGGVESKPEEKRRSVEIERKGRGIGTFRVKRKTRESRMSRKAGGT